MKHVILNFLVITFLKGKKQIILILGFYLPNISKICQHIINIKIISEIFYIIFLY